MARFGEHQSFNFVTVAAVSAIVESRDGRPLSAGPVAMGVVAACFPSLPDYLEPALHPNHRQFFHSWAVVGLLSYGFYRLYDWEPDDVTGELLRLAGLGLGAAYLAHLAKDSLSPKGLPLI